MASENVCQVKMAEKYWPEEELKEEKD